VMAEGLLPDSQCGFWRGHGCIDMIIVVRQLMQKQETQFMMFVDLKKAYDSVPREEALLTFLAKCGAPPMMLSFIRSFHEGM